MTMRKTTFSKRLRENVRASGIYLASVFLIALLMGACASSEYTKQTSSNANEAGQVSAKADSENGETDDGQKMECRSIKTPGSRMKTKTCLLKWQWALIDEERKEKSDQFVRDVGQDSRRSLDSGIDRVGGQSSGMSRP